MDMRGQVIENLGDLVIKKYYSTTAPTGARIRIAITQPARTPHKIVVSDTRTGANSPSQGTSIVRVP